MKTRMLIVGCIVCLVALMILGSCATTSETRRERKALFQSAESGDYAEVKRLIEEGADVNAHYKYGMSVKTWSPALMAASHRGHQEIVKLLIEAGADVNALDNYGNGYTALMYASLYGHTEVVKLLIEEGADVNVRNIYHHTALFYARGHPGVEGLLKEAGAMGTHG